MAIIGSTMCARKRGSRWSTQPKSVIYSARSPHFLRPLPHYGSVAIKPDKYLVLRCRKTVRCVTRALFSLVESRGSGVAKRHSLLSFPCAHVGHVQTINGAFSACYRQFSGKNRRRIYGRHLPPRLEMLTTFTPRGILQIAQHFLGCMVQCLQPQHLHTSATLKLPIVVSSSHEERTRIVPRARPRIYCLLVKRKNRILPFFCGLLRAFTISFGRARKASPTPSATKDQEVNVLCETPGNDCGNARWSTVFGKRRIAKGGTT